MSILLIGARKSGKTELIRTFLAGGFRNQGRVVSGKPLHGLAAAGDAPIAPYEPTVEDARTMQYVLPSLPDSTAGILSASTADVVDKAALDEARRSLRAEDLADADDCAAVMEELKRVARHRALITIMEVGGSEELSALWCTSVAAADAVMICYDVSDRATFEAVWAFWRMAALVKKTTKFPCLIVGNQIDRIGGSRRREVPRDHGEAFARIVKVPYFETTAKAPRSVENCFRTLVLMTQANTMDFHASELPRLPTKRSNSSFDLTTAATCTQPENGDRLNASDEGENAQRERDRDSIDHTTSSVLYAAVTSSNASQHRPPSLPADKSGLTSGTGSLFPHWMVANRRKTMSPIITRRSLSPARPPSDPADINGARFVKESSSAPVSRNGRGATSPSPIRRSRQAGPPASPTLRRTSILGLKFHGGWKPTSEGAAQDAAPPRSPVCRAAGVELMDLRDRRRSEPWTVMVPLAGAARPISALSDPTSAVVADVKARARDAVLFPNPIEEPLKGGLRSMRDRIYDAWRASTDSTGEAVEAVMEEVGLGRHMSRVLGASFRGGEGGTSIGVELLGTLGERSLTPPMPSLSRPPTPPRDQGARASDTTLSSKMPALEPPAVRNVRNEDLSTFDSSLESQMLTPEPAPRSDCFVRLPTMLVPKGAATDLVQLHVDGSPLRCVTTPDATPAYAPAAEGADIAATDDDAAQSMSPGALSDMSECQPSAAAPSKRALFPGRADSRGTSNDGSAWSELATELGSPSADGVVIPEFVREERWRDQIRTLEQMMMALEAFKGAGEDGGSVGGGRRVSAVWVHGDDDGDSDDETMRTDESEVVAK